MSGQNTAYINSAGYGPNGGLLSYFTNNNLLTLNQLYNMHQQVSYVAVAQGNNYQSQNYFAQTMDWGTSNNNGVRLNGTNEYISNNAALPSAPTFSQTFSYDGVNRLLSASENNGANWSQAYNYDQYGNMWMPPTSHPLPTLSGAAPTTNIYNASNNQNPNVNYDGAGNQTSLGSLTLSYDGENRQSQIANLGGGTGTFQYDGLGHRVVKSLPNQTTTYVYDAFGQLAAEYYSGTKPTPPCTTCFLTYDYLGNVRMVTDAQANIIARHDFAPFGQEITSGTGGRSSDWGSTTDVDMKFTGQIRDQESTEDFFNARYLAIALGRFNSPDPGNAGASLGSSQSWNGYGYVSGNPLALVDPSGKYLEQLGGCFFDRTDFYVDGNYDSSERTFIGCTSGGSGTDSSSGGGGGIESTPAKISALPKLAKQLFCAVGDFLALPAVASRTGKTVGFGVAGGAGAGLGNGVSLGAGIQLVADPRGNLGLAFNVQGTLTNVWGVGANEGYQAMLSNAGTISDLAGSGKDFGLAVGDGIALGVDLGTSDDNSVQTYSLTAGPGWGLKVGLQGTKTYTKIPISVHCGS